MDRDGELTTNAAGSSLLARLVVPVVAVLVAVLASVAAGASTSDSVPVPESETVTDRDDVIGEWRVIEVRGGPVPDRAIRRLRVSRGFDGPRSLSMMSYDGVNSTDVQVDLELDGDVDQHMVLSTAVGCAEPDGTYESCTRPSGFGVADAVQLRLTPEGELVLVGRGNSALAVYERAG